MFTYNHVFLRNGTLPSYFDLHCCGTRLRSTNPKPKGCEVVFRFVTSVCVASARGASPWGVERNSTGQARRGPRGSLKPRISHGGCSNCSYDDEDEHGKRGDKSSHHPQYKTPGRIHGCLSGVDRILPTGLANRNSQANLAIVRQ